MWCSWSERAILENGFVTAQLPQVVRELSSSGWGQPKQGPILVDYASSSLVLLPDLLGGRDLSWFPVQSSSWSLSTFAAELALFGQVLYHWESLYCLLHSSCHELCPKDSSPGQLSLALLHFPSGHPPWTVGQGTLRSGE